MTQVVDLSATICTPFTSASYVTLKSNVASWLARDDLTAFIPTFIDHAVSRLNRQLRIRPMEKSISVALDADGRADVPCDFIALRDAYLFKHTGTLPTGGTTEPPYLLSNITNVVPLEITTAENVFADFERNRTNVNSKRPKISVVGSVFVVSPNPSDSPNLGGMYYAKFQPLANDNTGNWITQNVPDLLLYAACLEGAVFTKDKGMIEYWESKYSQIIDEVREEHKSSRLSGSSLYPAMRVS